jgi:hypothetical protein
MRNLRIRYSPLAILLCCMVLAGCLLPNIKDQKPGQVCITLADRTVTCLPVDDHHLMVLRHGSDKLELKSWDARTGLDTLALGKVAPSRALFELLMAHGGTGQSSPLDPAKTRISFQDGTLRFTDRNSGKPMLEIALGAKQAIYVSPASNAGSYEYVLYSEEVCAPVTVLDSLLAQDDSRKDIHLAHCGDSLYARMGHVVVAISEIKAIQVEPASLPDTCRSKHINEGLVPTDDVASTLAELATEPDADEPATPGVLVYTLPYPGLRIYQCGDLLKFVPESPEVSPFYLNPLRCCYVLRRNVDSGLLEIYFSDLSV